MWERFKAINIVLLRSENPQHSRQKPAAFEEQPAAFEEQPAAFRSKNPQHSRSNPQHSRSKNPNIRGARPSMVLASHPLKRSRNSGDSRRRLSQAGKSGGFCSHTDNH